MNILRGVFLREKEQFLGLLRCISTVQYFPPTWDVLIKSLLKNIVASAGFCGTSFMNTKRNNDPKVEPSRMPVVIFDHFCDWPLRIPLCSTGASDRSFYPIFNKKFDHLETLLTIHRPKKVLSTGSLCGPFVPNSQSKCPKRIFILPQK